MEIDSNSMFWSKPKVYWDEESEVSEKNKIRIDFFARSMENFWLVSKVKSGQKIIT